MMTLDPTWARECAIVGAILIGLGLAAAVAVLRRGGPRVLMFTADEPPAALALVAYVGLDEFGSGAIGLKQGRVPAGLIPLVALERDRGKLEHGDLLAQLQAQADHYGVAIRLARFVEVDTLRVIKPRPQG